MNGPDRHITGDEHVAAHVGTIVDGCGFAIPADRSRIAQIIPDAEGNAPSLIMVANYIGGRGLYTLLTPAGARAFAADLLERADKADQHNAQHAAAMLARTLRGEGKA